MPRQIFLFYFALPIFRFQFSVHPRKFKLRIFRFQFSVGKYPKIQTSADFSKLVFNPNRIRPEIFSVLSIMQQFCQYSCLQNTQVLPLTMYDYNYPDMKKCSVSKCRYSNIYCYKTNNSVIIFNRTGTAGQALLTLLSYLQSVSLFYGQQCPVYFQTNPTLYQVQLIRMPNHRYKKRVEEYKQNKTQLIITQLNKLRHSDRSRQL